MVCCSLKKVPKDRYFPRRPADTDFAQQRLRAWEPVINASNALPFFFLIGVVFLPIGICLLISSSKVNEIIVDYTECGNCKSKVITDIGKPCSCSVTFKLDTKFNGQVYMLYQLTNFYQNYRSYVRSKDDQQFHGELGKTLSTGCKSYKRDIKIGNKTESWTIAPCGAIANSLFNDTFKLTYTQVGTEIPVILKYKNISWKKDIEKKFRNPPLPKGSSANKTLAGAFIGYATPYNWRKPVWQLNPLDDDDNGIHNKDLINWLRVSAFSTFRKLHRTVLHEGAHFGQGLPKGRYKLYVQYNYPVHIFNGKKHIVLSTATWIGGKNASLGYAYIILGSICLIFAFVFLVLHMKVRTKTRPLPNPTPNTTPSDTNVMNA